MDYQALADIWHQIMVVAPYEDHRLGQWLRTETGTDFLPQPGYVGERYRPGGTLLLAHNPGRFRGVRKDDEDKPFYAALTNMKEAIPNRLSAFHSLNLSFENIARSWFYYNKVLKPVLDAVKLELSDIAYINLVKWRSKGSIRKALYDFNWEYTRSQLEELAPGFIVVLGKGTKSVFDARYEGSADTEVVPRTLGDKYDSKEIHDARERLRQRKRSV